MTQAPQLIPHASTAMTHAEAERSQAADLPPVLVNPPWKSKTKRKQPAVLDLVALPIPDSERWNRGEREMAINKKPERSHMMFWADNLGRFKTIVEIGIFASPYMHNAADAVDAGDVAALVQVCEDYLEQYGSTLNARAIACLPAPMGINAYNAMSHLIALDHPWAIAKFGLTALPGLLQLCAQRPALGLQVALPIASTAIIPIAAHGYARLKKAREPARRYLLAHPEHVACTLIAPALGPAGPLRDSACDALRLLAANGQRAIVLEVASRYAQAGVHEALTAMLDENPLDRFPTRIASLPPFWQPLDWPRPVLRSNARGLPDDALEPLGIMLRLSTPERIYPGVDHVKQACTAPSLAAFAWRLFEAWLAAGAPPKEDWAFRALGLFGDDHTARKLTPYLRAWPGQAKHARAVTGLDVLMQIGSDTALSLLNAIALKLKFKGLQEKAREKIVQIAETRNLTRDELEDRMVPDLGLDAHGSMALDFGERQFRVCFDESLKPYVRDADGARLSTLPRAKKTDDAAMPSDASERFKLLKKEASSIAARQTMRLETAMCTRRRWESEVFASVLAAHPLLRHLVQRLVWGAYRVGHGASNGGTLLSCFRAAPDGGYTNADDDTVDLPQGDDIRIGIVHALELPASVLAAFGQLFSDYEMLQPFVQVGRETYALTAEELASDKLTRWDRATVKSGRVLSLIKRGWSRWLGEDAQCVVSVTKMLSEHLSIELHCDPGVYFDRLDTVPEQTLHAVYLRSHATDDKAGAQDRLSRLDPIAASELIRDVEGLR